MCVKLALKQQYEFIYLLMILYSFVAHDEELDAKFQAYQVDLLSKICDHVGWNAQPDEPHVTNLLRYVFDCLAFSEGSVVNNQGLLYSGPKCLPRVACL